MDHVSENYRQDAHRGLTTPSTAAPTAARVTPSVGTGELLGWKWPCWFRRAGVIHNILNRIYWERQGRPWNQDALEE